MFNLVGIVEGCMLAIKGTYDDQWLWDQFRCGNVEAFGMITRLHFQSLFNYGTRFSRDEELVKDCIQDLFLELWKNKKGIGPTGSIKFYLFKSIRRKLFREIRKSRPFLELTGIPFDAGFFSVVPVQETIEEQEQITQKIGLVRNIIGKLSKRQQEIIYLRYYLEADLDQIAEIMTLKRQSVYNLLQDAFNQFRKNAGKESFPFLL
ncbi:sigma-70 family RNA polymerase sigma factor [Flavihumibacter sp. RY-1]|uniref:Sigma-70 family RNA polymerase sigma factor n=1 Tax=Flavihumibacter fluminis TaxID=2909236 RepID=A0ABS9BDX0_9BACT|nr:sigma-70 family RNA polymerase sigma factor [Flavihumibacter fluminis]MCF1713701.1 sigma-70 family RNA polymerase sigma factor [Flavihumibacter fluminis]